MIPAVRRLRQEDLEFETVLSYTLSLNKQKQAAGCHSWSRMVLKRGWRF